MGGARRFAESGLLQFQPEGNHVELDKVVRQMRQERDAARKRVEQLDQALAALGSLDGLRNPSRGSRKLGTPDHVCSGSKKNRGGAAGSMGKVEGGQVDEIILLYAREYGFMPKKKTTSAPSKLTEVEQDLLAQLEHGYRLEADSLGGNPVLRRAKDNELLRPADANASTVKALEDSGLIRRARGPDPRTIAWHLTKQAK